MPSTLHDDYKNSGIPQTSDVRLCRLYVCVADGNSVMCAMRDLSARSRGTFLFPFSDQIFRHPATVVQQARPYVNSELALVTRLGTSQTVHRTYCQHYWQGMNEIIANQLLHQKGGTCSCGTKFLWNYALGESGWDCRLDIDLRVPRPHIPLCTFNFEVITHCR